jgi:hypothetical protein
MGIVRDVSNFISKVFKLGKQSSESLELKNIGNLFNTDFLRALPLISQQLDSRQGDSSGPFSLLAIFVTVLAVSLAVSPQLANNIRGETNSGCINIFTWYKWPQPQPMLMQEVNVRQFSLQVTSRRSVHSKGMEMVLLLGL